jgi:hypothetical protein
MFFIIIRAFIQLYISYLTSNVTLLAKSYSLYDFAFLEYLNINVIFRYLFLQCMCARASSRRRGSHLPSSFCSRGLSEERDHWNTPESTESQTVQDREQVGVTFLVGLYLLSGSDGVSPSSAAFGSYC